MTNEKSFLFNCDKRFYPQMRLAIVSLAYFNQYAMNIHVFTMDSPETNQKSVQPYQIKELQKLVATINPLAIIILHDVREEYDAHIARSINKDTTFTPFAALRLLAPFVIDEDVVVYIDADCFVCDDIGELFNALENDEYELAGPNQNLDYNNIYIISECLVFSPKKMMNNKAWNSVIKNFNENQYNYPDQDALNYSDLKIKGLSPNYCSNNYVPGRIKIFHFSLIKEHSDLCKQFISINPLSLFHGNHYERFLQILSHEYNNAEFVLNTSLVKPVKTV